MKKFLYAIALLAITATFADACPTLGSRLATRTKTVTTTKQTVELKPKTTTVEKTVLVPQKVQVTETKLVPTPGPTVTETKVKSILRGRLFGVATCAGCR